ncbi:hypothetical protein [Blattabacterium cuenoti]|uniref:hypothetical protein n=1 Tax=Blattabacterium cuenoti TaxID=1653831 RepID=UPI00163CFE59|nr:hypothetical protein [Blattabacterium cuenoti]
MSYNFFKDKNKEKKFIIFFIILGLFLIFFDIIKFNNSLIEQLHNIIIITYTNILYLTLISLGILCFLTIQYVSKSVWSVIIYPIMEILSSFLPYGCMLIFIMFIFNSLNIIQLLPWMNTNVVNPNSILYDEIIANKKEFLNVPFFLIRNIFYMIVWNVFYFKIKKISCILHNNYSIKLYEKLNSLSVKFIIFFAITSIFMGWDWIMFLNPHWISTIFSWYLFSSYLSAGIGVIILFSIYLNKIGYLSYFNEHHLHDLSKYLFSSSLLWTYFWFSQFLLYWYSNIPEEMIFFIKRTIFYENIHFWMLILNFLIPFFGLLSSKNKKNPLIVSMISIIILIGHYIDMYQLIIPEISLFKYNFGLADIGMLLIIVSIFLKIIFYNVNKHQLKYIGHPYFKESQHYKYPYM